MSNIVFILGAGASKQSGVPIMNEFLDTADLLFKNGIFREKEEIFKLVREGISKLQAVHSKSRLDVNNIESVFNAFDMAKTLGKFPGLEELEEIYKDNKIIDKRKQSGFYVDFDIKKDKILSTPESFNEEKTMNIETYEIFMQYSKDYFDEFQKNLDEKSVKKELENVRESMKYIRSFFSNQLEE